MAHMFTVCRVGQEWDVRDATGALYGVSADFAVDMRCGRSDGAPGRWKRDRDR